MAFQRISLCLGLWFESQAKEAIAGGDAARSDRVMAAMLTLKKIDLAALERAFAGSST